MFFYIFAIFLHLCQLCWSSFIYPREWLAGNRTKMFSGNKSLSFNGRCRSIQSDQSCPPPSLLLFHLPADHQIRYHLCSVQKMLISFAQLSRQPKLLLLPLFGICVVCQTAKSDFVLGEPDLYPQCSLSIRLVFSFSNSVF